MKTRCRGFQRTTADPDPHTPPLHSTYHELHPSRHHDGPEGQRVRADGSDHDGRHVGVDHGGSRGGGVRSAASGRGHDHPCREGGRRWEGCGVRGRTGTTVTAAPWCRPLTASRAATLSSALTVALHWRDESSVQVQVHVGQVGGGASVHHHLVQHLPTHTHTRTILWHHIVEIKVHKLQPDNTWEFMSVWL